METNRNHKDSENDHGEDGDTNPQFHFDIVIKLVGVKVIRKGTYKLEKKTGIILAIILILTPTAFASLHYYINLQKSNLRIV